MSDWTQSFHANTGDPIQGYKPGIFPCQMIQPCQIKSVYFLALDRLNLIKSSLVCQSKQFMFLAQNFLVVSNISLYFKKRGCILSQEEENSTIPLAIKYYISH